MLLKLILLSYLISNIFSYIILPLNEVNQNFDSISNPQEIIQKLSNTELYITLELGSERTKIKAILSNQRNELIISGKKIKSHKYDESLSKTYFCVNNYTKEFYNGFYKEVVLSKEDFYMKNEKNEIQYVEQINFLLGTKTSEEKEYEGIMGLQYYYMNSLNDYNLVNSLKNKKIIDSYYWFLNFDNIENNEEGKMYLGTLPHLINNKLDQNNFRETPTDKNGYWGLDLSQIYYGNSEKLTKSYQAYIRFDFKLFFGPNELMDLLDKKFFNKYIKENLCFKEIYGIEKNIFYYCKNRKEVDITKFNEISFKNVQLNTNFVFDYKDLFYYKDDLIFFLIIFREVDINSFRLGQIFLKKYNLVFNQDKKTIGYYSLGDKIREKEENFDNKNYRNNFSITNILLILILFCLIFIGILFYKKRIQRKMRANELEDQFQYEAKKDSKLIRDI